MNELVVRIDGDTLQYSNNDIEFGVSNSEEGDYLKANFTNRKDTEYAINTYCTVEWLGKTYHMIVDADTLIKVNANTYIHQLTLKSAIHYFDDYLPPDRVFTEIEDNENITIAEALDIYATTTVQGQRLFTFDDLDAYNDRLPRKEYTGQNLGTILVDIFKSIDAYPMLEINDNEFKLFPRYKGEYVGDKPIELKPNAYESSIDSTNNATRVMANIKNAIYENRRGTWFPSPNGTITPRTEELVFSLSNARYILDNDIMYIYKAIIPDGVKFDETSTGPTNYRDLDVSSRFVPKEVYDVYPDPPTDYEPDNDNQSNLVPYNVGSPTIGPLYKEVSDLFESERRMLYNAALEAYFNNEEEIKESVRKEYPDAENIQINTDKLDYTVEVPMRFKYLSSRDMAYTIEKQDIKDMVMATILSNQRSSRVEIQQHKRAMSRLANRLGERHRSYTQYHRKDDKPPELGEWTESGYIVTKATYIYQPMRTKVTFEMNKNFANIDAETSISNTPDPFSITGKEVTTNTQTHEYIEISEEKKPVNSYLTELGRNVATNLFNYNSDYNKNIETTFYYRIGNPLVNVPLPGGDGDVITIHNQYTHPTLAYYGVRKNEFSDLGKWQRKNVIYTDSLGRVQSFELTHVHGYEYEDPLDEEEINFPQVEDIDGDELIRLPEIKINLDPNAALAHTHNIHIVTDNPEKIINTGGFSELNNLHQSYDEQPELKVYHRPRPYNLDSVYITDEDTEDTDASISYSDRELDIVKSDTHTYWCLVKDNRTVFAYNGDDQLSKTFYINFLKERSGYKYGFGADVVTISMEGSDSVYEFGLTATVKAVENPEIEGETSTYDYDVWGYVSVQPSVDVRASEHQAAFNITGDVEAYQSGYEVNGSVQTHEHNVTGSIEVYQSTYEVDAETSTHAFSQTGDVSFEEITAADEWEYIGTSGTEDDSVNAGSEESCRTSSEIKTWLDSNEPATDYNEGYIIKVNHGYYVDQDNFGTCTSYYYEAIKN